MKDFLLFQFWLVDPFLEDIDYFCKVFCLILFFMFLLLSHLILEIIFFWKFLYLLLFFKEMVIKILRFGLNFQIIFLNNFLIIKKLIQIADLKIISENNLLQLIYLSFIICFNFQFLLLIILKILNLFPKFFSLFIRAEK